MKESALYETLRELARCNRIRVCSVNMRQQTSYGARGGHCRVRDEYRIIIDKHLHLSEKIDILIEALQNLSVDTAGADPVVVRLLGGKQGCGPARQGELFTGSDGG